MAVLYVTEQGSSIYRERGMLVVKKDEKVLQEIPIAKVDKVIIVGGIFISTSALNLLLNNHIFTSFITIDGRYKGSFFSGFSKNIDLRLKQFEKFYDEKFKERLSKVLILNKIKNLYSFLLKHKRNNPNAEMDDELSRIKNIINKLKIVQDIRIPQLLGVEGMAARYYFKAFGKIIKNEFTFTKRTMYPPKDQVNSLLSLGYTLLLNEFVSLIYSNGLDPFIGFLHSTEYGRESLAVDMIEEFRFVVDSFVLKLINKKIIVKNDFIFDKSAGYYKLDDRSKKIFYDKYEDKLLTEIHEENIKRTGNYHNIFQSQVNKLSKFIDDKVESYIPFSYR